MVNVVGNKHEDPGSNLGPGRLQFVEEGNSEPVKLRKMILNHIMHL